MAAAQDDEVDELGRLQWIAYHLSAGEFAEAEELGWDGSREDPCATSKASAALAARTAVIAKEEEGRLEWIAHHLAQRDFSGARELGWEGSEADPAAAASAAAAAAARAARAAAEKVAAADIATKAVRAEEDAAAMRADAGVGLVGAGGVLLMAARWRRRAEEAGARRLGVPVEGVVAGRVREGYAGGREGKPSVT